jgi:hypothetical protein
MAMPARNRPVYWPTEQPERRLHLVETVGDELRHLHDVEERGDTGAALVIVVLQVAGAVFVLFAVLVTLAYAFYFGWL